jgi:hypothetical protein
MAIGRLQTQEKCKVFRHSTDKPVNMTPNSVSPASFIRGAGGAKGVVSQRCDYLRQSPAQCDTRKPIQPRK